MKFLFFSITALMVLVSGFSFDAYSQNTLNSKNPPEAKAENQPIQSSRPFDADERLGFLASPEGIVPDSKCAECHPRHVRLMHQHLTKVGTAKTRELTQGMINLAVECQQDESGSIVCLPCRDAKCLKCHALSVSAATLSLVDLKEMHVRKKGDEILGHSCLTCHPPRREKKHHLKGNIRSITNRASQAFLNGCGGCHAEGLAGITSGGSPHDWLAKHVEAQQKKEQSAGQ